MLAFFAAIFIAAKLPVLTLFAADEGLLATADCLSSASRAVDNDDAPAPAAPHHGGVCACVSHAAGLPSPELVAAIVSPTVRPPAPPRAQPIPTLAHALPGATGPPARLA